MIHWRNADMRVHETPLIWKSHHQSQQQWLPLPGQMFGRKFQLRRRHCCVSPYHSRVHATTTPRTVLATTASHSGVNTSVILGVGHWFHFCFGGVHAFGYDKAESEPIWMKSGALWVHCWRLTLADFGQNPRSNDSWRAKQKFLSGKQRTISPISRRPNFAKFEQNTSIGVAIKTFGTEF